MEGGGGGGSKTRRQRSKKGSLVLGPVYVVYLETRIRWNLESTTAWSGPRAQLLIRRRPNERSARSNYALPLTIASLEGVVLAIAIYVATKDSSTVVVSSLSGRCLAHTWA